MEDTDIVQQIYDIFTSRTLGNGVGYGDYAAAVFFLKEVIDALCNGYGSEIVQGNDQFQIAAGTGDTGIADHAVQTFGMQLMQLVYSGLSSFRGCQVHADIAVLQIDIDDFVSFLK